MLEQSWRVNGDAVVAEGHRAQDRFAGERTAAAPEAIVEPLKAEDRLHIAMALRAG